MSESQQNNEPEKQEKQESQPEKKKEEHDENEQEEQEQTLAKHSLQCGGASFDIYTHYKLVRAIGQGAYGIVCSAINTQNNTNVAIKKISNLFNDLIDAKRVLREIKLLSKIFAFLYLLTEFFKNKNIVQLLDIVKPDNPSTYKDLYLVFELMQTDLEHVISSNQVLTDKHINWFMFQILSGLYHMHSADVIHRDLKPNNLFVNKNCHLKIGDLNLARKFDICNQSNYVVTRWYRAPEIILSQSHYTKAIDIWSVGCIFAELLGRTILFQGKHPVEQIEKIVAVLGTPQKKDLPYEIEDLTYQFIKQLPKREPVQWKDMFPYANPLAVDLLSHMLIYHPDLRYTSQQCLEHEYFQKLYEQFPPELCPENFDWSFDSIDLNKQKLMDEIYSEALKFQQLNN